MKTQAGAVLERHVVAGWDHWAVRLTRASGLADLLPAYEQLGLTYTEVGATGGALPAGYYHTRRTVELGAGRTTFEHAARALGSWDMHRRAGLRVAASGDAVAQQTAVLGLGRGLALVVPCRVVYVVNEPNRRGFAYGTLPDHPETGEQAFVVTLDEHNVVRFQITAFSRPDSILTRVAGPLATTIQAAATRRYGRTLSQLAKT